MMIERLYVANWRRARGLNQSELARLACISRQTLNQLEDNRTPRPRMTTLSILAHVLGCEVADLYKLPPSDIKPIQP